MNKLVVAAFLLSLIATECKAQKVCDSIFTIKIYDSVSRKPIDDATITIKYSEERAAVASSNKKGVKKFKFPIVLDWEHRDYLININALGYYYKSNIILSPDKHCVQKIYLEPWGKDVKLEF